MAQGEFTKQEADEVMKSLTAIFEGIPKSKRLNFIGELNDVALFIEAAKRAAPDKPPKN